jgi:GWxTD domain-containing protein
MKTLLHISIFLIIAQLKSFSVEYNILQFKYDENKTLLEFNFQMHNDSLEYKLLNDSSLYSNTKFNIIISSTGIESVNNSWEFQYYRNSSDSSLVLFDKRFYTLFPGQYEYKITINTGNKPNQIITGKINIRDFNKNSVLISDILFAHQIDNYDSTFHHPSFKKINLFVVPNVEHTISGIYPFLKYYFEVYNIDTINVNNMELEYIIQTGDNKKVYSFNKKKGQVGTSFYDYGMIPVDTLKNGVYKLIVNLYNNDKVVQSQLSKFYVLDPSREFHISDKFVENLTFERSPFAVMLEERVKYEYEIMKILLSEFEIEKFEMLNSLRAQQRALYTYWKERDPDTTTAVNELMTEFQERVEFAKKYFSKGDIMPGWKTERGRILLKYGFPSNREIFRAKGDKKAAEEWQYDELYGGSYFFFVDRFGDNTFLLVHSTSPNEIKNYNWFQEFNPAIDNNGSPKYNSSRNSNR